MEIEKFGELEEKIKDILEEYSMLKSKRQELENLLSIKNRELEEANSRIAALHEEKDTVRGKVDSMLDMLRNVTVANEG